jgi:hypothetical protein
MIESEHGRTNAGAQEQKAQHLSQQKDEIWPVTEPTARGTLGWCALSTDRIKIQRRMRGNQNRWVSD